MRMAARVARSASVAVFGAAAALAAAGCPYVAEGELRVATGSTTIGPGSQVAFLLYCDRLFAGWELAAGGTRCAGTWGIGDAFCPDSQCPGTGDAIVGTITACGVYTAPAARPPSPPVIAATECSSFNCADACGASLTLDLSGYDVPPR